MSYTISYVNNVFGFCRFNNADHVSNSASSDLNSFIQKDILFKDQKICRHRTFIINKIIKIERVFSNIHVAI